MDPSQVTVKQEPQDTPSCTDLASPAAAPTPTARLVTVRPSPISPKTPQSTPSSLPTSAQLGPWSGKVATSGTWAIPAPRATPATPSADKPLSFKLQISQEGGLRLAPTNPSSSSALSSAARPGPGGPGLRTSLLSPEKQLFFLRHLPDGSPQLLTAFPSHPNKLYLLQPSPGQHLGLRMVGQEAGKPRVVLSTVHAPGKPGGASRAGPSRPSHYSPSLPPIGASGLLAYRSAGSAGFRGAAATTPVHTATAGSTSTLCRFRVDPDTAAARPEFCRKLDSGKGPCERRAVARKHTGKVSRRRRGGLPRPDRTAGKSKPKAVSLLAKALLLCSDSNNDGSAHSSDDCDETLGAEENVNADDDLGDFPFKIDSVFSLATGEMQTENSDDEGDIEVMELKPVISEKMRQMYSMSQIELRELCGPSFVVLERLSPKDIEAVKGGLSSCPHSICSDHCRKRTLHYLCMLGLIRCPTKEKPVKVEVGDAGFSATEKGVKRERDDGDLSARATHKAMKLETGGAFLTPKVEKKDHFSDPSTKTKKEHPFSNPAVEIDHAEEEASDSEEKTLSAESTVDEEETGIQPGVSSSHESVVGSSSTASADSCPTDMEVHSGSSLPTRRPGGGPPSSCQASTESDDQQSPAPATLVSVRAPVDRESSSLGEDSSSSDSDEMTPAQWSARLSYPFSSGRFVHAARAFFSNETENVEVVGDAVDTENVEVVGDAVDTENVEVVGDAVDTENVEVVGDAVDTENVEVVGDAVDTENVEVVGDAVDTENVQVVGDTVDTENVEVVGDTVDTENRQVVGDAVDTENKQVVGDTVDTENVEVGDAVETGDVESVADAIDTENVGTVNGAVETENVESVVDSIETEDSVNRPDSDLGTKNDTKSSGTSLKKDPVAETRSIEKDRAVGAASESQREDDLTDFSVKATSPCQGEEGKGVPAIEVRDDRMGGVKGQSAGLVSSILKELVQAHREATTDSTDVTEQPRLLLTRSLAASTAPQSMLVSLGPPASSPLAGSVAPKLSPFVTPQTTPDSNTIPTVTGVSNPTPTVSSPTPTITGVSFGQETTKATLLSPKGKKITVRIAPASDCNQQAVIVGKPRSASSGLPAATFLTPSTQSKSPTASSLLWSGSLVIPRLMNPGALNNKTLSLIRAPARTEAAPAPVSFVWSKKPASPSKATATLLTSSVGTATLTPSSMATTAVTSSSLATTKVTSSSLATTTLTSSSLATTTLTSSSLANANVTSSSLAATTLTSSSLATTKTKVTSSSLATTKVTSSSLAITTLTSSSQATTTVSSSSLANAKVTSSSLATTTVTSSSLAAAATVATSALAAAAVTSPSTAAKTSYAALQPARPGKGPFVLVVNGDSGLLLPHSSSGATPHLPVSAPLPTPPSAPGPAPSNLVLYAPSSTSAAPPTPLSATPKVMVVGRGDGSGGRVITSSSASMPRPPVPAVPAVSRVIAEQGQRSERVTTSTSGFKLATPKVIVVQDPRGERVLTSTSGSKVAPPRIVIRQDPGGGRVLTSPSGSKVAPPKVIIGQDPRSGHVLTMLSTPSAATGEQRSERAPVCPSSTSGPALTSGSTPPRVIRVAGSTAPFSAAGRLMVISPTAGGGLAAGDAPVLPCLASRGNVRPAVTWLPPSYLATAAASATTTMAASRQPTMATVVFPGGKVRHTSLPVATASRLQSPASLTAPQSCSDSEKPLQPVSIVAERPPVGQVLVKRSLPRSLTDGSPVVRFMVKPSSANPVLVSGKSTAVSAKPVAAGGKMAASSQLPACVLATVQHTKQQPYLKIVMPPDSSSTSRPTGKLGVVVTTSATDVASTPVSTSGCSLASGGVSSQGSLAAARLSSSSPDSRTVSLLPQASAAGGSSPGGLAPDSASPQLTAKRSSVPGGDKNDHEAKRARLEQRYPLPAGVVIKTEPVTFGYPSETDTSLEPCSSSTSLSEGAPSSTSLSEGTPCSSSTNLSGGTPYSSSTGFSEGTTPSAVAAAPLRAESEPVRRRRHPRHGRRGDSGARSGSAATPAEDRCRRDTDDTPSTPQLSGDDDDDADDNGPRSLDRVSPPAHLDRADVDEPEGHVVYDDPPVLTPVSPVRTRRKAANPDDAAVGPAKRPGRIVAPASDSLPSGSSKAKRKLPRRSCTQTTASEPAESSAEPEVRATSPRSCTSSTFTSFSFLPPPFEASASGATSSASDRIRQLKEKLRKQNEELEQIRQRRATQLH